MWLFFWDTLYEHTSTWLRQIKINPAINGIKTYLVPCRDRLRYYFPCPSVHLEVHTLRSLDFRFRFVRVTYDFFDENQIRGVQAILGDVNVFVWRMKYKILPIINYISIYFPSIIKSRIARELFSWSQATLLALVNLSHKWDTGPWPTIQ